MRFWGAPGFINDRLGGEKALAWAQLPSTGAQSFAEDSWLVGSREALHVLAGSGVRLPWEQIRTAGWDPDTNMLTVEPVDASDPLRFVLDDAGRLLDLIRERVTASVVLERPVPLRGIRGVCVVARRAPTGGPVTWSVDHPAGVDLTHPDIAEVVAAVLSDAQGELD